MKKIKSFNKKYENFINVQRKLTINNDYQLIKEYFEKIKTNYSFSEIKSDILKFDQDWSIKSKIYSLVDGNHISSISKKIGVSSKNIKSYEEKLSRDFNTELSELASKINLKLLIEKIKNDYDFQWSISSYRQLAMQFNSFLTDIQPLVEKELLEEKLKDDQYNNKTTKVKI